MAYPAADQQRHGKLRRQTAGRVDGGDHRVTSQHHQVGPERGRIVRQVIFGKPVADGIHRSQGFIRQGWEDRETHRYLLAAFTFRVTRGPSLNRGSL